MVHVYYLADARDLVAAGADGFLHLVGDEEMDDALVGAMKAKHMFVTPNLSTKQQRSVARLNAAGVTIALGDDTGITNTFYGYGEHRELELMVAAGMTPMQALVAATRTIAAVYQRGQAIDRAALRKGSTDR
jgi:imidazolonepropionase-like amidohydrolase